MKNLTCFSLIITAVTALNEEPLKSFSKANNLFTSSFYKQIAQEKERSNFLISPYSLGTILAFAQSGCKDETAQEIRSSLHLLNYSKGKVEGLIKESISAIKGNDLYTLHTANKIYVKNGYSIKDAFKKAATEVYSAEIENIDFTKNVDSAKTINEWVEDKTASKIKKLVSPNILDEDTRTVLINALYFKGNWTNRFEELSTEKKAFYKDQEVKQVDTMHHYKEQYNYCECSELDAKFLELPFEGDDVKMTIVLPNKNDGISSIETQLDKIFNKSPNFTREVVNVALPKFKIESTIPLKEILKNLGIKKAFNKSQADLSEIAGDKGDLVFSDVLQKTFIGVEEGGVEAAAATYIAIAVETSLVITEPVTIKEFKADHPFLFYIKAKNVIIFAGRVSDPIF